MKHFLLIFFTIIVLLAPASLTAVMTGGQFEIYADSFSVVPGDSQTTTDFSLFGTGLDGSVSSTGGVYELREGFQAMDQGILSVSLDSDTLALGTLSTSTVATGLIALTVSTDSETGYAATLSEDGDLRSGANTINDVSDGSVTAGSEEYGVRTVGTDGLLATDTAISGSLPFASSLGEVTGRSTQLQFGAAIDDSTPAGSYAHTVSISITVNP